MGDEDTDLLVLQRRCRRKWTRGGGDEGRDEAGGEPGGEGGDMVEKLEKKMVMVEKLEKNLVMGEKRQPVL